MPKHNPRPVSSRRDRRRTLPADFELVFDETGHAELKDSDGARVWSSDSDDEFSEEFDEDFFDGDDADEIIDYLIEQGHVGNDDEIDIVEIDLEESDDGQPLEGELIPKRR